MIWLSLRAFVNTVDANGLVYNDHFEKPTFVASLYHLVAFTDVSSIIYSSSYLSIISDSSISISEVY